MLTSCSLRTGSREEFIDVTAEVRRVLQEKGISEGLCVVYVPHTTAGVTINENADPAVRRDILTGLRRIVPDGGDYRHMEGNSPAHIKTSLIGSTVQIPIVNGNLQLGTWQGIYFTEFDGPRMRKYLVQFI